MNDVPKPPQIAALDTDPRGYPVFYTVARREPIDFRVIDPQRILIAGLRRLCGICGQPLSYWAWFLGGPQDVAQRGFAEPGMHKDCADYALAVCPYLSHSYEVRRDRVVPQTDQLQILQRPERMALYMTRNYRVVPNGPSYSFLVAPAKAIEWRGRDGKPVPA